jgi:hypothetical protein
MLSTIISGTFNYFLKDIQQKWWGEGNYVFIANIQFLKFFYRGTSGGSDP